MTDKQKKIFEKMLKEEIQLWTIKEGARIYLETTNDRYVHIRGPKNVNWDDYEAAWEAYQNVPLVKALG